MSEISKTADQVLAVLEAVAEFGPLTATALARRLGMHRTVVHRAVETLLRRGYLRRCSEGYLPGATVLRLAGQVEPQLMAAAAATLARLARAHGETFILTVPDGDEAVQIDQAVGSELVRVELVRGFRHSLAQGASGRAILAFMDAARVERIAEACGDPKALMLKLKEVRARGFAVSHDELSSDVHGLSIPIRRGGEVIASLGVVLPSLRRGRLTGLQPVMRDAAALIEAALTG